MNDGFDGAIDGMANTPVILVADWFPGGEMAAEQDHIDYFFIDLRGRDFRVLKCNVHVCRDTEIMIQK